MHCNAVTVLQFTLFFGVSLAAAELELTPFQLEPWRNLNFQNVASQSQLFGESRPKQDKLEGIFLGQDLYPAGANRISSAKLPGEGLPIAIDFPSPRNVSQAPLAPHHLEGFPAAADDFRTLSPSPAGAASTTHLLVATNSQVLVQNRQGQTLSAVDIDRFFAPAGPLQVGIFFPRAAYDSTAKRWIIAALADPLTTTSAIALAVSRTEDPLGEWRVTRWLSAPSADRSFFEMKMALAGSYLMMSADIYRSTRYENTQNHVFLLSDLYQERRTGYQFQETLGVMTPVRDEDRGNNRAVFASIAFGLSDASLRLVFREISRRPNGEVISSERSIINAGEFDPNYSLAILPQGSSNFRLLADELGLSECVGQSTQIFCAGTNFLRFGNNRVSVVQFYNIQFPGLPAPPTASILRIEDPSGRNFYSFASLAINKNRDVFIGYNRFRDDRFVGAYFALRRPTDPPGAFFHDGLVKDGEDSFTRGSIGVWGTNTSTVVDPADDLSFWTLQPYAASRTLGGTSQWGTWWMRFQQRNSPCTYQLDRSSTNVPHTASEISLNLTTSFPDCRRMIAPNGSWIRTLSVSAPEGNATISFRIDANLRGSTRTATINIGSQVFTVNQAANPLPPPPLPLLFVSQVEAPRSSRIGESISVTARVRNLGTAGAGAFRIGFYLSPTLPVTAASTFTGFGCVVNSGLVTDEDTDCIGNFQLPADFSPGSYYLAAIADDREQVLMLDRAFSVRTASSGPVTINPALNAPDFTSNGLVHGASARGGALAPGMIFVLYGSRLGPASLTTLALDANGRVATNLAGTRVLFNGIPAPMIYTSAGQISGIVPYALAGRTDATVEVQYNNIRSLQIRAVVAPALPALFTVDFSGANQVAALNENGSVNSAGNPAPAGSIVVLYGTGGGTFQNQPVDGEVIGAPLPQLLTPLTVSIGGATAEVLYAGPAPGLVSGVFQINVRIPAGLSGPSIPVVVSSGTVSSPPGTTIAVQ
jgi:uncharacterized protein (TIGR03437 family)